MAQQANLLQPEQARGLMPVRMPGRPGLAQVRHELAADLAPKRSISLEIGTEPAIVATHLDGVAAQVLAVSCIILAG